MAGQRVLVVCHSTNLTFGFDMVSHVILNVCDHPITNFALGLWSMLQHVLFKLSVARTFLTADPASVGAKPGMLTAHVRFK